MPGGDKSRRRAFAMAALLTEPTVEAAARKAMVSHRTLKSWLAEPEFAAEFQARARQVLDNACAFVNTATQEAVETLRRSLTCGKPSTEVRAADSLLNHSVKFGEMMDFLKRLEALERRHALTLVDPSTIRNGHSEHQATNGAAGQG